MVEEIFEVGNTTKSRCFGVCIEKQAFGKEPWINKKPTRDRRCSDWQRKTIRRLGAYGYENYHSALCLADWVDTNGNRKGLRTDLLTQMIALVATPLNNNNNNFINLLKKAFQLNLQFQISKT